MKIISLFIFVFCVNSILAQDITFPTGTKPIEMVAKLFEGKIDTLGYNLGGGAVNAVHNRDSLYTLIDTVFVYETNKFQNMVIVTYSKEDPDAEYHASRPWMSIIELNSIDSTYHLKTFYKYVSTYGAFGSPGKVDLLKITEDDFCIRDVDWDTGQGYTYETTTLYYEGTNILSFINHEDNEGAASVESDAYEYNTTMAVDPEKKQIVLHKKGTEQDEDRKAIAVDEITRYEFIDGQFVKIYN